MMFTSSFSRSLSSLFSLRKVFCSGSETIPRTCSALKHQSHSSPCHQNSPPHLWLPPLAASWLQSWRSRLPLAASQRKPEHDEDDLDVQLTLAMAMNEKLRMKEHLSILLFFSSALSSSPPPKLIVNATGESLSSSWIVIVIMMFVIMITGMLALYYILSMSS